jgi:hypothetical protein
MDVGKDKTPILKDMVVASPSLTSNGKLPTVIQQTNQRDRNGLVMKRLEKYGGTTIQTGPNVIRWGFT